MTTALQLDFDQVRATLPQAYPFIMIDRVLELVPMERIVASKNVSGNEWPIPGHFPGKAVYPGVLLIEAMAQAAILLFAPAGEPARGTFLLAGVRARFLHPAVPGDTLIVTCVAGKMISTGGTAEAEIRLSDGETVVAKADLTFAIRSESEES